MRRMAVCLAATAAWVAPGGVNAEAAMASQTGGSVPATTNVRGAQYPRVHPDGRVTFRLQAPDAARVRLLPGGSGLAADPIDMVRGSDGTWTVTTPPVVPGFHYYWLEVDGVAVNDPGSETFFGWGKQTSGIEVPGLGAAFYEARHVPHGEIRTTWYHSEVTGAWRRALVYTPPGYDASRARRFPVLYLLHGAGEDERGWSNQGRAGFILDNLIAEARAVPMLVVMDTGYAARTGEQPKPTPDEPWWRAETAAFRDVLLKELIPHIDAAYRTRADRLHRAMAGLSMGGAQTLQVALGHLDAFAYIGAFSSPPRGEFDAASAYGGVFRDAGAFNKAVRLLWLGAGTEEAPFHQAAQAMHHALARAGARSVFVPSPGTAHEWQTWRRALHDFAPRLFRR